MMGAPLKLSYDFGNIYLQEYEVIKIPPSRKFLKKTIGYYLMFRSFAMWSPIMFQNRGGARVVHSSIRKVCSGANGKTEIFFL